MDCLDRTNVVQSMFARTSLTKQLVDCGIFKETDRIDMFPDFERMYRNSDPVAVLLTLVWADNADSVSKAYSGTGALKADFTRTGIRSTSGILNDGRNSIERYIRNNFFDVTRQDAYDLVLGNFQPWGNLSRSQFFVDYRPLFIQAVPYILYASISMILAGLILPRAPDTRLRLTTFLAFWLAIFLWSVWFIINNGRLYVHWPRLVPLDFAPDLSVFQRDRIGGLERGEGEEKPRHKREISISPPKGPKGIWGALFGRWLPGHYGGGEDVEVVGERKDRAHAE
jgi:phosphatidylinositol 4-phosphatase